MMRGDPLVVEPRSRVGAVVELAVIRGTPWARSTWWIFRIRSATAVSALARTARAGAAASHA